VVIGTDFEYCFHNDSIEFLNSALIETDGQPMKSKIKKEVIVIKSASSLRQVGGFLQVLRFPPPIKLTATI
jgi:hypothetical protein